MRVALACLFAPALLLGELLTPIPETRLDRTVRVESIRGPVQIPVRTLDLAYPGNTPARGYLAMMHDPASNVFFWWYQDLRVDKLRSGERPHVTYPEEFIHDWLPSVTEARLVFFTGGYSVGVYESVEKASDMDDSERKAVVGAIAQLRSRVPTLFRLPIQVSLGLDREFIVPKFASWQPKPIRILSVSRVDDGWKLVVECQWREEVILDDRYRPRSHRKLPLD